MAVLWDLKGPLTRVLSTEQPLRGEHRVSLGPAALTLAHTGVIWGRFQSLEAWVPSPEILGWGEAWALGDFRSSPGNSEVQSGVRSTELRGEEGTFQEDDERDLSLVRHELVKARGKAFSSWGGGEA